MSRRWDGPVHKASRYWGRQFLRSPARPSPEVPCMVMVIVMVKLDLYRPKALSQSLNALDPPFFTRFQLTTGYACEVYGVQSFTVAE